MARSVIRKVVDFKKPQATSRPLIPNFDCSGICLLESQHATDFRMEWTRHDFLKVITALRGRGDIRTHGGAKQELSPGRIAVVPAGVEHRLMDRSEEPLLIYILCVGSGFPLQIPTSRELYVINDPSSAGRALRRLREIASLSSEIANSGKRYDPARHLLRSGLVATLVGRLALASDRSVRSPRAPDSEARVRDFISRLPGEFFENRRIDEVSADLAMSRRRFTQLFKELTGESYAFHIRKLRVAHACRLLRDSDVSPVTVAFECGYGELSTFYRDFRSRTGISPAAWARNHRSEG